jgi:hypothetical protein
MYEYINGMIRIKQLEGNKQITGHNIHNYIYIYQQHDTHSVQSVFFRSQCVVH